MGVPDMSIGKILVCDDDRNICELLRLYLEKEGYAVVIANDGEEALAKFSSENPDLMLLDIMMPKLDGYELLRQIRETGMDMPVLMVTAKQTLADKKKGFLLGADDYMMSHISPSISKDFQMM